MAETVLDGILSMDMGKKVVVVPGVAEIASSMQRFEWPDYISFIAMLMVCMAVGLYFGCYRASTSAEEYLVGNKRMKTIPITMSLIASFVSGISILGIPTETYLYGTQYSYIIGGLLCMSFIMNYVYLPVFYNLNITTTYEYLERRFDRNVRILASVFFTVDVLTWLPIVIYVPALAFNQVTGINVHLITPIICLICIFYTTLGGIKAVVWTDVIQTVIMIGAMILVAIKGTIEIGGFNLVLDRNLESGRIESPNFDMNPTVRYTFWSLTIGGTFYLLQTASINQSMIQRYMSLPSLAHAKRAVWFFSLGLWGIVVLGNYCGLLIYTTYYKCDPLTTKLAKEKDQLLPLLVMQVFGDYPGLSGVFVAGILSAALSSLSTGLNSMAAVVLKDFYSFFSNKLPTEKQANLIMKSTVVIFGIICVCLVYIVQHLGSVFQLTMSLGSIASGSTLGLFTMGILLPWVNARSALIGGLSSLVCMACLVFKAQTSIAAGELVYPEKPLTVEGCHYHFIPKKSVAINIQFNVDSSEKVYSEEDFVLHHVSYLWYTLIGTVISVTIGLVVSFATQPLDPRDVDPALLASCVKKFIKPREFPNEPAEGIIYAYEGNDQKEKCDKNIALQTIEEPE